MAVEATHLNIIPSHFVQDREILMNASNERRAHNQKQMWLPAALFPATESRQPKTSINTESGLTCNVQASRKRSRDSGEEFYGGVNPVVQKSNGGGSQFFGGNIMHQIQNYQVEIDAVIYERTKKIRLEMQERQKQQAKLLVAAMGESTMETLRERDDQIQKMTRLNLMLQEKVKVLYAENQLWREMAETNEAAANSLRTDLHHALAQFGVGTAAAMEEKEVESCGSCSDDGGQTTPYTYKEVCYSENRRCRRCGGGQCSVLVLPCRHLCLCSVCGSGSHHLQWCPVCHTTMTATLHVNMS